MLRLVVLRFLESYFRHRWLYLLPIVAMIGVSVYFVINREEEYVANGVLYVQTQSYLSALTDVRDPDAPWYSTPADITSRELNDLLQTKAFLRAVVHETDLEEEVSGTAEDLDDLLGSAKESIWVFPSGSNQLAIGARHTDSQIAYQLVNAIIDVYLRWQINAEQVESETAGSFFTEVIEDYELDLAAAREAMRRYLEEHPRPLRGERPEIEQLEMDRLQGAIDLAASRLGSALEKEENTRLALTQIESDTRQRFIVIDAPAFPTEPEGWHRRIALQVLVFVGAGVALSLGAIAGAAIIDRSFRFPIDVTNRLDLPVLSTVPDATVRYKWYQIRKRLAARKQAKELSQLDQVESERVSREPIAVNTGD